MTIFRPASTEDRLAWIPIIGCFVPMVLVLGAIGFVIWRLA